MTRLTHLGVVVLAWCSAFAPAGSVVRLFEVDPATSRPQAERVPSRVTAGTVRVGHARPGGFEIVEVPLEEYVARVVAAEAAPRSEPAALDAVAIAVRTFAAANAERHRADGFDLCDSTHCQVMGTATPATVETARRTAGRILLYDGRPAAVFFTASCGGQSELPEDVWPRAQHLPFLTRHKEAACRVESAWTSEIAEVDFLRALHASGFAGERLREVSVARKSRSGRAAVVRLKGLEPAQITGDALRAVVGRSLGWQRLKSTAFSIKRTRSGFKFSGHGSGHGVGLCLVGAARMAADGRSAERILEEYFPGTEIRALDPASGLHPSTRARYQQMPR